MKAAKARRLRAAGWKLGSAREFLRLSDQEAALVDMKLCLMDALRQARRKRGISQIELAKRMGSSQSRIAKIEAGDPSVSLDLILRALVASGASRREIQDTLASGYPG
jgi:ribosome-binding protein aMBF1 (putative translation factor)